MRERAVTANRKDEVALGGRSAGKENMKINSASALT